MAAKKQGFVDVHLSLVGHWHNELTEKAPSHSVHIWNPVKSQSSVAIGQATVDVGFATFHLLSIEGFLLALSLLRQIT
jgi:hypothetical protein